MAESWDEETIRELWRKTLPPDSQAMLDSGLTYRPRGEDPPPVRIDPELLPTLMMGMETWEDSEAPAPSLSAATNPTLIVPAPSPDESLGGSASAAGATGGGYIMRGEIGRGGMGVVFRAEQSCLKREVAIKKMRDDARGAEMQRKFVAEAVVTGLLDHPNIVPIHELGRDERGDVMLSMKLVEGLSWKSLLRPKTDEEKARAAELDFEDHLRILIQVCHAIAFAHSRGVVHCDLKPENVMVGSFGEVLVMDWGLAVDVRDEAADQPLGTPRRMVAAPFGTPAYMPPELAEGRGADIGPWTDVYLLGSILHELITGRPPHRGARLTQVILSALLSAPPKFSEDVPEELQGICREALEGDTASRTQSAEALREALELHLRHRESLEITRRAQSSLEACQSAEVARSDLYSSYAEAVASFRQARVLWEENAAAASGEQRAREAFATAALSHGDLGLARAQAALLDDAEAQGRLLGEVEAREAARERARSAARWQRRGLIAATIVIVVGLSAGLVLIEGSRREARRSAEAAERARGSEASARRQEASARGAAEAAAREAREAEAQALEQRRIARQRLAQALFLEASLLVDQHRWSEVEAAITELEGLVASLGGEASAARLMRWRQACSNPPPLITWTEGTFHATAAAASADGERVAVGRWDGAVIVYELEAGRLLEGANWQRSCINGLAFHPNGRYLFAGDAEGKLVGYDLESGTPTLRFPRDRKELAHPPLASGSPKERQGVQGLAVTPDGRWLISGGADGRILFWEVETQRGFELDGGALHRLEGRKPPRTPERPITALTLSPDGQRLAVARGRGLELQVFERRSFGYARIASANPHFDEVRSLAFSPHGDILASASSDRTLQVWRIEGKDDVRAIRGHRSPVEGVAIDPSGRILHSLSRDGELRRWDLLTGELLDIAQLPEGRNRVLCLASDGELAFVAGDASGSILMPARARLGVREVELDVFPSDLAIHPSGQLIATSNGSAVDLIDALSGRVLKRMTPEQQRVEGLAFEDDALVIASYSRLERRDLATGEVIHAVDPPPDEEPRYEGCERLASGRILAWTEHSLVAFEADGRARVAQPLGETDEIIGVSDGREGGEVLVWGKRWIKEPGHHAAVPRFVRLSDLTPVGPEFAPSPSGVLDIRVGDGGAIVGVGGSGAQVHVMTWSAETGELTRHHVLRGHEDRVQGAWLLPGARVAMTAGEDGRLRLWQTETGRGGFVMAERLGPITALEVNLAGGVIVLPTRHQGARLLDLRAVEGMAAAAAEAAEARATLQELPDSAEPRSRWARWLQARGLPQRAWRCWQPALTRRPSLSPEARRAAIVAAWSERAVSEASTLAEELAAPVGPPLRAALRGAVELASDSGPTSPVHDLAFAPAGSAEAIDAAYLSEDGELVGTREGATLWRRRLSPQGPRRLIFDASGEALITGALRSPVTIRRSRDGSIAHALPDTEGARSLALSPDGLRLVIGLPDGHAEVWRLQPLFKERRFQVTPYDLREVVFSDASTLLAGDMSGRCRLWSLPDPSGEGEPSLIREVELEYRSCIAAVASEAGSWLVEGYHVTELPAGDGPTQRLKSPLALQDAIATPEGCLLLAENGAVLLARPGRAELIELLPGDKVRGYAHQRIGLDPRSGELLTWGRGRRLWRRPRPR